MDWYIRKNRLAQELAVILNFNTVLNPECNGYVRRIRPGELMHQDGSAVVGWVFRHAEGGYVHSARYRDSLTAEVRAVGYVVHQCH